MTNIYGLSDEQQKARRHNIRVACFIALFFSILAVIAAAYNAEVWREIWVYIKYIRLTG